MKLVYFGNNYVGLEVLRWLVQQGVQPAALVVHPEGAQRCAAEMIEVSQLPAARVFDGSRLREASVLEQLAQIGPTLGLSVFFGYIMKPPLIRLFPDGVLNLHPSYLPYNRGAHPNVWSIVEGTPAGATLHYIDEGVDTGDIVAQRQVEVALSDTAKSLYHKLEQTCIELFQDAWSAIEEGRAPRVTQTEEAGTTHRVRDLATLDRLDLERQYTGKELIDILRARTFPPHPGVLIEQGDERVYVRVEFEPAPDPAPDGTSEAGR